MKTSHTKIPVEDTGGVETDPLVGRIVEFVHLVRAQDFHVGVREGLDALRVAKHCTVLDKQRLRWGLRSLLCGNADEWQRFDQLFDLYWLPSNRKTRIESTPGGRIDNREARGHSGQGGEVAEADQPQFGDAGDAGEGGARGGASLQEKTTGTDFCLLSDARLMWEMEQLVERLALKMRRRLLRRQRFARHGQRVHLRRTIRKSLRYGGTPLDLVFRQRRRVLPRLILLLDVSRSMSLYSYLFLRFARGVLGAFRDAHAFVYHTRLVPVTEVLRERNIDAVKEKLALISLGWSGGTRIGECAQTFNQQHAQKIVNSRSIVVMVSDGYDTGAPELLAEQLQRIRRRARKLIWLNPLLGRDDYQPTAAGMQAALPFVDVFASAHSLESLKALESQLVYL
jgi:uncharacterized protein with von Willebrand factor type A (vWA) domain